MLENNDILECINEISDQTKSAKEDKAGITNPRHLSPLVLAYLGDAVFELAVRAWLVHKKSGETSSRKLHKEVVELVNAGAQANILQKLEPILTSEEKGIARRGRNAKSYTKPKNSDVIEYKHATALEALLGYLFLKDEKERFFVIIEHIIKLMEDKNHHDRSDLNG